MFFWVKAVEDVQVFLGRTDDRPERYQFGILGQSYSPVSSARTGYKAASGQQVDDLCQMGVYDAVVLRDLLNGDPPSRVLAQVNQSAQGVVSKFFDFHLCVLVIQVAKLN